MINQSDRGARVNHNSLLTEQGLEHPILIYPSCIPSLVFAPHSHREGDVLPTPFLASCSTFGMHILLPPSHSSPYGSPVVYTKMSHVTLKKGVVCVTPFSFIVFKDYYCVTNLLTNC